MLKRLAKVNKRFEIIKIINVYFKQRLKEAVFVNFVKFLIVKIQNPFY